MTESFSLKITVLSRATYLVAIGNYNFARFAANHFRGRQVEILLWLYGPEKFTGLSRNGPQVTKL